METPIVVEVCLGLEVVIERHGEVFGVPQNVDDFTLVLVVSHSSGQGHERNVAVEDPRGSQGVEELLGAEAEHQAFLGRAGVFGFALEQHVQHLPHPVGPCQQLTAVSVRIPPRNNKQKRVMMYDTGNNQQNRIMT